MPTVIVPSDGDRIDLGGKIPQFDAFAWFAYKQLVINELDWIKVADREALTLDDIQYSTKTEVHAFQVKWSNLEKPEPFSFQDLKNILPEIFAGWKAVKLKHTGSLKKLKVHLLSNRPPSSGDNVRSNGVKIGVFVDFLREVWYKLKNLQPVEAKWTNVFDEFKTILPTQDDEWNEFVKSFEINLNFTPGDFGIKTGLGVKQRHLRLLSRFLLESVIDKAKPVEFKATDIVAHLGWDGLFATIFNHELFIDPNRYQPISETSEALEKMADQNAGGYIFLLGGPGTGKSTLLTEWSKNRNERIIRYYAFDFTAPSALTNNADRGETINFYFDLVLQLRKAGFYCEPSLPDKDISFLRKAFGRQIEELSKDYIESGKKTILIIDGLDHIPRYIGVQKPLLAELLLPSEIPEGVLIILGSQSFELESLPQEIKQAWKANERSILMSRLTKPDVEKYINKVAGFPSLSSDQKEKLYKLSQGHPLYLSYLVNKIKQDESFFPDDHFFPIDGDINVYYEKFWSELETIADLKHLLGLCARIKGPISLSFIGEWNLSDGVQLSFKRKAMFLFNNIANSLSFFHNSFRQFLFSKTASSILNEEFDDNKDAAFHAELAGYYQNSSVEPHWNAGYHLYKANKIDQYLQIANPDAFTEQLLMFRSEDEIDGDIKTGLLIGQQTNATDTTLRYLLSLNELKSRSRHAEVASFIEIFIRIGNIEQAKKLIRNDTQLLLTDSYALDCSKWLYKAGERQEAKLIYTLAIPEEIKNTGIVFSHKSHDIHNRIELLEKWAGTAALFENAITVAQIVSSIQFKNDDTFEQHEESGIINRIFYTAGQTYIKQDNWAEYDKLMESWSVHPHSNISYYSTAVIEAAQHTLHNGDMPKAMLFITKLKTQKDEWKYSNYKKLRTAALLYSVNENVSEIKKWIQEVPQPALQKNKGYSLDITFDDFTERILLNSLLCLTGNEPNIMEVVTDESNPDDQLRVEFERKLVLIAKLQANGITGTFSQDIWQRSLPIVRFYYPMALKHNTTWYSLDRMKKDYFTFLLDAASRWGQDIFHGFVDKFLEEIKTHKQFWKPEIIREILIRAFDNGYPKVIIIRELKAIENDMLEGHDTSGRVDECILHARAWVHCSEKAKALFWLSQSLKESFSVGYRKDYQFNRWLDWLVKVSAVQPDQTAKRLTPFLGFLPHLQETAEGGPFYSGARKVLKIGFSIGFSIGVQQFIWQMNKGIIGFEDGLIVTMSSMISMANSEKDLFIITLIYEKLLLYIATDGTSKLLKELLDKQLQLLNRRMFNNNLRQLIKSINIYCLERNRSETIRTIQYFLEEKGIQFEGLPELPIKKNPVTESNNDLTLMPDHRHLTETEVLSKINSFADFKATLILEDKANSHFSWKKVFQKISHTITLDNLNEICALDQQGGRQSELLSLLSIRATELKDETLGRHFANSALAHSSSSGWASFYDGGTRLHSMRAFQKINLAEGRELAMRVLTEDITQSGDPDSTLEAWDEILPFLTGDQNPIGIWKEIESYLQRLFANANLITAPEFMENDSNEALVMLLVYLSNMKMSVISTTSKTLIAEIAKDDPDILAILHNNYNKSAEDLMLFSEIALLLSVRTKNLLSSYSTTLQQLALSENFTIRTNTVQTLSNLGLVNQIPSPPNRELPTVFSLQLPADKKFRVTEKIKSFENIQDTEDYLKIISSHQQWLSFLVEETSLAKENIVYRWVMLINEKGEPNQTSYAYEKELQKYLNKLSIDFPFYRPRVAATQMGLSYLLSELIDAGVLDKDLDPVQTFSPIDASLEATIYVEERPPFVVPLSNSKSNYLGVDWTEQIEQNKRKEDGFLTYGDDLVIAELSNVKQLSWGNASETYSTYCQLNYNNTRTGKKEYDNSIFGCCYRDYFELQDVSDNVLTFSNNNHYDFHPGFMSKWIAFNPAIALRLNWIKSEKRNFAWENTRGDLMAYSVYWKSGNIYMSSREKDSEAAEGWYVVLTRPGKKNLKDTNMQFTFTKKIVRESNYDSYSSNEIHVERPISL